MIPVNPYRDKVMAFPQNQVYSWEQTWEHMPKESLMKGLTDTKIKTLTTPGRYGDRIPTLYLIVKSATRKPGSNA